MFKDVLLDDVWILVEVLVATVVEKLAVELAAEGFELRLLVVFTLVAFELLFGLVIEKLPFT